MINYNKNRAPNILFIFTFIALITGYNICKIRCKPLGH